MASNLKHKFHQLVYACNIGKLSTLLNKGADVNIQDNKGYTALHIAASLGNYELIELLSAYSADANICNKYGELPLHIAIRNGDLDSIAILLHHTKNVNIQDRYGNTPLHLATSSGNLSLIRALLARKVFVNYVNEQGDTPLSIAEKNNNQNIVALLRLRGGAKTLDTLDAIKYAYISCELYRKLSMILFSLITIGCSVIATVATAGELILSVIDSIGASLGMMMVCLEKPYREFRMHERKKFNGFYKSVEVG